MRSVNARVLPYLGNVQLVVLLFGIRVVLITLNIPQLFFSSDMPLLMSGLNCRYCDPRDAPYGLLWYEINGLFTTNVAVYMFMLSFIDLFAMLLIRKQSIFPIYYLLSIGMWRLAPMNLSVMWLILLGFLSKWLLSLAVIAKLPIGAPDSVWHFILSNSVMSWTNWTGYVALILLWLWVLSARSNLRLLF